MDVHCSIQWIEVLSPKKVTYPISWGIASKSVKTFGILRNHSPKDLGVLRGNLWGFGYPNDALLAKATLISAPAISIEVYSPFLRERIPPRTSC